MMNFLLVSGKLRAICKHDISIRILAGEKRALSDRLAVARRVSVIVLVDVDTMATRSQYTLDQR